MSSTITPKALGQRVRQLRTRKGLTQQDLAGEDYSKSYISAIEQGKTRPSLEALQRMASKLEVPAGLLLDPDAPGFAPFDPEAMPRRVRRRKGMLAGMNGRNGDRPHPDLQLMEAELLIATGHAEQALTILPSLLPPTEESESPRPGDPSVIQKTYHLLAEANLQLERPSEVFGYLEAGMELATRLGDRDSLERMRNLLGLAHYQAGQPLSALEEHRTCLEAVEAGAVRDPNFKLLVSNNMANDYAALHDSERAAGAYKDAADLLAKLGSFDSQAEAYWELAAAQQELGNYTPARRYASRALNVYEAQNNVLLVAQMESRYGLMLLKMGKAEEAEQYLTHSLELCEGLKMDCDTVLALNNLLRVSLERGDLQTAGERSEKAVELGRAALGAAEAAGSRNGRKAFAQSVAKARRALAGALTLAGEVATAKDDHKTADKLFSEAIQIIEVAPPDGSSGEIYQRYAQVLAGRGQHEKASKYFERAYQALAKA